MATPNSASFSDSVPPFYTLDYSQQLSTTTLAQTELLHSRQNHMLAQEEIEVEQTGLRSGERSHRHGRHSARKELNTTGSSRKETNVIATHEGPSQSSVGASQPTRHRATQLERFKPYAGGSTKSRISKTRHDQGTRRGQRRGQQHSAFASESGGSEQGDLRLIEDGGDMTDEVGDEGDCDDDCIEDDGNRAEEVADDSLLIPKPEGEAGRPGRGGYTLEEAIGWAKKDYKKLKDAVKKYVDDELDINKNFSSQSSESIRIVYTRVLREFPRLSDYENNWPVTDLIRYQLQYKRNRNSLNQARADAEIGRRMMKVAKRR